MGKLDGKVALITGAGEGIGRASALLFAKEGAKVAIAEVNPETCESVAKEVAALGGEALPVLTDVRDRAQCKAAVEKTAEWGGSVDILEMCAIATKHFNVPFEEITDEHWKMCIESGIYGDWELMKDCMPYMQKKGWGRIITFGSGAGVYGDAGQAPYAAVKEAVRAITKVAAREWGPRGITVNCIVPSAMTRTVKAWADAQPEQYEALCAHTPLGGPGDPERDIAPVALFLASEDGRFITGQTIMADGFQKVLA